MSGESPRPVIGLFIVLGILYFWFLNPVIDYRLDQRNDAIDYLALTRTLVETGDYPSRHWPPGMAFLFAPLMGVVGLNLYIVKAVTSLMGLATLALLWTWVGRFAGSATALWVVALTGFSWPFFDYAHRFLSEIPFALATLAFLVLYDARPSTAGFGRARYVGMFVAAAIAQLVRGNGLLLILAVLLVEFAAAARDRRLQVSRLVLIALLALPSVAWQIRAARVDLPGIHGVTYLEEMLAKEPHILWSRQSKHEAIGVRADARDFLQRIYRNYAWGQIFNVPALVFYPLELIRSRLGGHTAAEVLLVAPMWVLLLVGLWRLARSSPASVVFVTLNLCLVAVWPWPWGGVIRFVVPLTPMFVLAFCLALRPAASSVRARVLALMTVSVALTTTSLAAQQARHPYADADFSDVLALIASPSARSYTMVVPAHVSQLPFVLTGVKGWTTAEASAGLNQGRSVAFLWIDSSGTQELSRWAREVSAQYCLEQEAVEKSGAATLFLLTPPKNGCVK